MAYDPSQYAGAAEGYATQAQLDAAHALANTLMFPKQQQTLYAPWQGISNVANSLIGGYFGHLADLKQLGNMQKSGVAQDYNSMPQTPPTSESGQPLNMSDIQPNSNAAALMPHAIDQLRREGVPEQNLRPAAAHLVGQAKMESDFNPNLTHDGGIGYGLYGANGDRLKNMLSWMQNKDNGGYSPNSAEGQIRYMAHEAMTDPRYAVTRGILMGATPETLQAQTRAVTGNFERPRYINDRRAAVLQAFQSYQPNQGR